jgi:hypothetical protein
MYVGGSERNFPTRTPATTAFEGSDGRSHPCAPWSSSAGGLRIHYMEKADTKFVAVRIADGTSDVVLANAMVRVPGEHFGFGVRLGPEPTLVEDDLAILKLLEDVTRKNAGASAELLPLRTRLKARAPQVATVAGRAVHGRLGRPSWKASRSAAPPVASVPQGGAT